MWRLSGFSSFFSKSKDKQQWIRLVNDLLENGNEEEQIIAAESLAKIKLAPISEVVKNRLDTIQNLRYKTFLQWCYAFESKQKLEETTALFVNNCTDSSINSEVRRLSAYALGYNFVLSSAQQERMQKIANKEDTISLLQNYLVWCTYILSTNNVSPSPAVDQLEKKVIALSRSTVISDRFLMATALAKNGKIENVNLLKAAFSQELKDGGSQDVLYALSFAILKIDRKEPYNLSSLDWTVVGFYFISMVMIGIYYSKRNKSVKDFVLGGKTMGSFTLGVSLFATMMSSLSYLSYPGEMIRYGPIIFAGLLAFPITHWVVGWYIIPKFMEANVVSAYELLEKKLGLSIRVMASFFFVSLRFMWMATIIYATVDTAISAVFEVSPVQRFIFSTPHVSHNIILFFDWRIKSDCNDRCHSKFSYVDWCNIDDCIGFHKYRILF